jgi:preprotein translocase subunit SecG
MQRFLLICVFLFFVVVVILAFGEEYGISATNQMFATLAGGFLPYILRFVLFKQPEPVTVDPDNLSFKSKFKEQIEEYTQNWQIANIRIDSKRTCIKGEQKPSS